MNKLERHECMLRLASEHGTLYLNRARAETGASLPTVRRDFEELALSGAVERVRGGIRIARKEGSLPFNLREAQHSQAKAAIARKAVKLLKPGNVIMIDGGTTTYHMCFCLPRIPLRIITNSLRLCAYLDDPTHRYPDWEIYLTGGFVHHGSNMLTGPGTLHTLDFYYADWAFLSIGGIAPDGLYNTSETVVETERRMIERARSTVILADQSKLGQRSMCRVCSLSAIDRLIVDYHPGRSLIEEDLIEAGCRIEKSEKPAKQ